MEENLIKNILSRLDRQSFKSFALDFFKNTNSELNEIKEIGSNDIYYEGIMDSYGESLHTVFIFDYLPLEIFSKRGFIEIARPSIESLIQKVGKHYKGKIGYWGMVSPEIKKARQLQNLSFITNVSNYSRQEYNEILFPQYSKILEKNNIKADLFIGSYDSFSDNNLEILESTFSSFFSERKDGLVISLEESNFSINHYTQEKNLFNGLVKTEKEKILLEPTYVDNNYQYESILLEFENLIKSNVKEHVIEDFMTQNYKSIFGFGYDRIETQIWLKFPEIDFQNSNRRLDIFLRNSIDRDWELFEIKRPGIKLTRTYRDVNVFRSEITNAIQQLQNYKRLLSDNNIKKKFAKAGIEYFEPILKLVVGRRPSLPTNEWRWLIMHNQNAVKIITYDDLVDEMRIRLLERNMLY